MNTSQGIGEGETRSPVLVEVWRGDMLESVHRGAAVVASPRGDVVVAWGEPERIVLPRSAIKMVQALPLIESGAAEKAGLDDRHLALACASHSGRDEHTALAAAWLTRLGLVERDLRCGAHMPFDEEAAARLIRRGAPPSQLHNNCSGKHCGFLTVARHLGVGLDYVAPAHPVQQAVRRAIEETAGETVAGFVIDGCSAPNFALSLRGLATAMARFARPNGFFARTRADAAARLVSAMAEYPELVAGPGRPATRLIRAAKGRAVAKSGAEGVFTAVLSAAGLGIAVKIDDGAGRAAAAVITALLARFGALEREDPVIAGLAAAPLRTWRGQTCGRLRVRPDLLG